MGVAASDSHTRCFRKSDPDSPDMHLPIRFVSLPTIPGKKEFNRYFVYQYFVFLYLSS